MCIRDRDSPALAAGLQSGDVITEMDGEAVYTVDSYESKLLALKPEMCIRDRYLNSRLKASDVCCCSCSICARSVIGRSF